MSNYCLTYLFNGEDAGGAAECVGDGAGVLPEMFLLGLLDDQRAAHLAAQPRLQYGEERAARPQLPTAIAPRHAVRLGDGLRFADHVERLAAGAGLQFAAGEQEAGRPADLNGGGRRDRREAGGDSAASVSTGSLVGEEQYQCAALSHLLKKKKLG